MRIGIIQGKSFGTKTDNLAFYAGEITKLAQAGANVICLPEMFATDYLCHTEDFNLFNEAETIHDGITNKTLCALAKELKVVIVGGSILEEAMPGVCFNTCAVIDADGSIVGYYRKNHIPQDPGFEEKFYFTPGNEGYKVFQTRYGKIGVLICWDQWFPEAARIIAMKGAELLVYPTAIGWDMQEKDALINQEQYEAWRTIQLSHAVANGVFVASINRVGEECGTRFWGGSFIANPMGRVLQQGSHTDTENLMADIDFGDIRKYRYVWPFLRDRRVDTYSPLLEKVIKE